MDASKEARGLVKGARNGAVLGAAIRLPFALLEGKRTGLRGAALWKHVFYQVSRGAFGVGSFVVVYKLARIILHAVRGGGKNVDGLTAFLTGGLASFVTLYYDPSTSAEILLYVLKLLFESIPKEAVDKGVIKPPPYLFALINFLTIGLFFFYYESRNQYLKSAAVKGIKGLLAD